MHHVKPILQKVELLNCSADLYSPLCSILSQIKHLSPKKVDSTVTPQVEPHSPPKEKHSSNASSLLEGIYDEAGSAKSFQEALAEWRGDKESGSNKHATKGNSIHNQD